MNAYWVGATSAGGAHLNHTVSMEAHGDWLFSMVAMGFVFSLMFLYAWAAYRQLKHGRHWPGWRLLMFTTGCGVLALAVVPEMVAYAHRDLRGHMIQHLLIGMLAPLGLVLGAPMSLTLRSVSVPWARRITAFLQSGPIAGLCHPVTAASLNIGGMYLLYLTPLYAASLTHPLLHYWVHWHFLVAGYLFTWAVLAWPDPAPRRPTRKARLSVLFIAIAAHTFLAKAMFAYLWPRGTGHGPDEIRAAAQWMYYGGDVVELLLLVIFFGLWYRSRSRRLDEARFATNR